RLFFKAPYLIIPIANAFRGLQTAHSCCCSHTHTQRHTHTRTTTHTTDTHPHTHTHTHTPTRTHTHTPKEVRRAIYTHTISEEPERISHGDRAEEHTSEHQ